MLFHLLILCTICLIAERGSNESLSHGASSGERELMSRDDTTVHDSRFEEQSLNQAMKSDSVSPGNHAESENIKSSVNFEGKKVKCDTEPLNAEGCEEDCRTCGPVEGDINYQAEGAKTDSANNTFSEDLTSC